MPAGRSVGPRSHGPGIQSPRPEHRNRSCDEGAAEVIYELREYQTVPGRMPALIARFRDHTLELFARHGLEVVFMSQTEFGDNITNELVYVLAFTDHGELHARWASFLGDPEWQQVKADSERDGPIVAAVRRRVLTTAPFD